MAKLFPARDFTGVVSAEATHRPPRRRGLRRLGIGLACVIGLVMAPAPASSEDYEAMRMMLNGNDFAPHDTAGIMFVHRYGMCLAAAWGPGILSLLPKSAKSKDELFGDATADSGCGSFEDRVRYSPTYYRGPIAEYYLAWLHSGKKISNDVLQIYPEPSPEQAAKLKPEVRVAVAFVDVGSCVDTTDHEETMKLFQTKPDSPEEGQVLTSLTGALSNCIPPGMQLTFSKFILRGFLAEGAFRNAVRSLSAGK